MNLVKRVLKLVKPVLKQVKLVLTLVRLVWNWFETNQTSFEFS